MKRLAYISIITSILILPIIFWLDFNWNISILSIDIKRLRFAFIKDKFLLFATLFNLTLYIYSIITIMKMKNKNTKNITANNIKNTNNQLQNTTSSWHNLYDGKRNNNNLTTNNIQKEEVKTEPINNNNNNKLNVDIKQNTNQIQNQTNIINMPNMTNSVYANQIENLLTSMGYDVLGDLFIEDNYIDIIAIGESDSLLLIKINSQYGEVVANEEETQEGQPPMWFSNENKYISPVFEVKNAHTQFVKMINETLPEDNGVMVKPIVVMTTSNISNSDDMLNKWKELGVDVVKFFVNANLKNLNDIIENKSGKEVMASYKKYVNTLIKYFTQKYKKNRMKKAG